MKQVIRHVIPQEIFVKTNKFVAMVYFESFRSSLACSSPHPAEILEWDLATHCAKLFKGKTFCLLHRDESSFYLFLPWLASVLDVLVGRFFLHFPHKKKKEYLGLQVLETKDIVVVGFDQLYFLSYLFNFWYFYLLPLPPPFPSLERLKNRETKMKWHLTFLGLT